MCRSEAPPAPGRRSAGSPGSRRTRSEERRVGKEGCTRRRHTRSKRDWSSDVCSSDLHAQTLCLARTLTQPALPTTFGLKAAAWAAEVNEVQGQAPFVDYVQVGGAAGTRAAIRWFAGESTD